MEKPESWTKGMVVLVHRFQFPDEKKPRAKYCVLLEAWDNGKEDILIALTTSKVKKYTNRKDVTLIKANTYGLPDDSLIHSGGLRPYNKSEFANNSKYISTLPEDLVKQIIAKISYTQVDTALFIRARGITKFP